MVLNKARYKTMEKQKTQTRAEQVAKEIVVYTQNNVGNTPNCFDFALEEINKYFIEKENGDSTKLRTYLCANCGSIHYKDSKERYLEICCDGYYCAWIGSKNERAFEKPKGEKK